MKTKPTKIKKGDKVTMLFHYGGLTSEETHEVTKVSRDGTITIDNDVVEEQCFRFNAKTGACLNDNTWGGASRTLKL